MTAAADTGAIAGGQEPSPTALLEVTSLRTRFETSEGVVNAVNGVSFQVEAGETVAIVGESGCGKSVTMHSILRLLPEPPARIESGTVLFKGSDLCRLPRRALRRISGREISMVFQDPMTSLNPVMTIGRQISEGLRTHLGIAESEARLKVTELLRLVGVPSAADRLDDYPHQFSGGMRQRVMIAMALACDPALLIADEPTTALDVTIQAQILRLVNRLKRRLGMSVIWVTHDLGVVARLADRVAVMYAGAIVEEASVTDFYRAPLHPYSRGLLQSLPGPSSAPRGRLLPIGGQPPSLLHLPPGCAFADRCPSAVRQCRHEAPSLDQTRQSSRDRVACWRWREFAGDGHAA